MNLVHKYVSSIRLTGRGLSVMLRVIAAIAGLFQLFFGDMIIGVATLLSVGAIALPAVFTHRNIKTLPIEFELIFITMVLLQFVIGETFGFYVHFPYYDRLVHFSLPMFVGFISFMLAYTLHETKMLNISTVPLMFVIVFMTLGVGAFWEIIEYMSDGYLNAHLSFIPHLQGNAIESPNVDTMRDLIDDLIGGVIGALLGLRYINSKSSGVRERLKRIVSDISANFKTDK